MKSLLFILILCSIFSFYSISQETEILKRSPYTLKVSVDNNSVYETQISPTPYLFPNNGMQIYPGETIYVETEYVNGTIIKMIAVNKIRDSSKTLIIKFTQTTKKKVHEMMMLEIHNPFPKSLVYNAKMFLLKENKWVNTNVYPVPAKLSAFETWGDIIITLGLGNWKFKDE